MAAGIRFPKTDIGALTEDAAQAMVTNAFSSDFVFRSPRKVDGKETTDVLVLFDDVGLVIQVKSQALDGGSQSERRAQAWARKNLAAAVRQVGGAVRAIRDGRMPVIENPRRGKLAYPAMDIKWLYGLVVLHHQSEPYSPMALCPALSEAPVPIHVFSLLDFYNLCHLLDTPSDLICYLENRSHVLIPRLSPLVHQEVSAFTFYLENLEHVFVAAGEAGGRKLKEQEFAPYAAELRKIATRTHPHLMCGRVIDHIIEKAHTADVRHSLLEHEDRTEEQIRANYGAVAMAFGRIPRARRIALGRAYLKIAQEAAESGEERFHSSHSPGRSECTLLVCSPLPQDMRRERARDLASLTLLLKQYHQVRRAIGVATEPEGQMGSSYDMVYIDSPPLPHEDSQRLGREVFGKVKGSLLDP